MSTERTRRLDPREEVPSKHQLLLYYDMLCYAILYYAILYLDPREEVSSEHQLFEQEHLSMQYTVYSIRYKVLSICRVRGGRRSIRVSGV